MSGENRLDTALATAGKYLRDGVAFFRRANAVAADPRVRLVFERLARHREETLKALEAAWPGSRVPPAARAGSTAYPFEAVAKVECYVCGLEVDEIPTSCPSCGAARYAFEKELTKSFAWGTAVSSGQAGVAAFEAAVAAAPEPLKATLHKLLERERQILREAEEEVAAAKA